MRHLIAGLLLASLVACKDQAPQPPTVNGNWSGSTSTGLTMTLLLSQDGTAVSGNGSISGGDETLAATVSGTYITPTLSVTIEAEGFESVNYSGTHSGSTITGTLNGSGFQNRALTLTKQ